MLYELAHHEQPTATDIGKELGLDAGYLSRMLRSLEQRGFVAPHALERRRPAGAPVADAERGRRRSRASTSRPQADVAAHAADAVGGRSAPAGGRDAVDRGAAGRDAARRRHAYLLRPPQAGDLGWIVHRQAALYARGMGLQRGVRGAGRRNRRRVRQAPASRRRSAAGSPNGTARSSARSSWSGNPNTVAKLRLLLVEPSARGLGIGSRLIDECVRFARQAGYRKITLWTQSELDAARRLYKKAGFTLTAKKPHDSFGRKGLVAETWDLAL